MAKKQHVVVIYGGKSTEHEVSCRSAAFIFKNLDPNLYEVHGLGIDKHGRWWPQDVARMLGELRESAPIAMSGDAVKPAEWVARLLPELGGTAKSDRGPLIVFPIIHGTFGEDGTLQGLLDLTEVAYVGADTLASAIGMNKVVAKRLVEGMGVPVVPYVTCRLEEWRDKQAAIMQQVQKELSFPVFVKPASLGSSVGISKVKDASGLKAAVDYAFTVDEQVLIEKGMDVREIEYGALGSYEPEISAAGEIVPPEKDFYSYEQKYSSESAAQVKVPADLPLAKMQEGQEISRRVFKALQLYGMARVDLFLTKTDNKYYFNEVNTVPGFTSISQYPQLWKHAGLSGRDLLNRLLGLAMDRYRLRQALVRSHW